MGVGGPLGGGLSTVIFVQDLDQNSTKVLLLVKFYFFRGKWRFPQRFPVLGPSLRDLISSYRHGSHEKKKSKKVTRKQAQHHGHLLLESNL